MLVDGNFVICTYILYILHMMTSVNNDHWGGAWEKPQMPTIHATQSQKQVVQSTVEQMWHAQVVFERMIQILKLKSNNLWK